MHIHSILWRSDLEKRSTTRCTKIKALMDMTPPNKKREIQAFLDISNYLSKFSPVTAVVCDPLQKLTSSKVTWTWNPSYLSLFDKAKLLVKS